MRIVQEQSSEMQKHFAERILGRVKVAASPPLSVAIGVKPRQMTSTGRDDQARAHAGTAHHRERVFDMPFSSRRPRRCGWRGKTCTMRMRIVQEGFDKVDLMAIVTLELSSPKAPTI